MKFDFYFFDVSVIRSKNIIAVPDMQRIIIIIFIRSPLIGENSVTVDGSLGISTVSEAEESTGSAIVSKNTSNISAEKIRFKPKIHLLSNFSLLYYNTELTICQHLIYF